MVNFQRKQRYGWEDLLTIMHLLRAPEGCPWDREQTHQSIRRNFLEETYEALDAIDRNDTPGMCEELGDVLLQVVFHAVMEEEQGTFHSQMTWWTAWLRSWCSAIPMCSVPPRPPTVRRRWRAGRLRKRRKRGSPPRRTLWKPSPIRCLRCGGRRKIVSRSVKAGFNWDSAAGALDKLDEETAELRQAVEAGEAVDSPHGVREEIGDALFVLCKIAQMSGVRPGGRAAPRLRQVSDPVPPGGRRCGQAPFRLYGD